MRRAILPVITLLLLWCGVGKLLAADLIGNCEMSGAKGDMAIAAPAVAGQFTVATSLPAPTWWNSGTAETTKDGFEYCLAANIAWHAGFDKMVVLDVPWTTLTSGQAKGFDLAMAQIAIGSEHKLGVQFSVPYFPLDYGVLAKPGTAVDTKSLAGQKIGALTDSAAAAFALQRLGLKSVTTFTQESELFAALHSGQVDAVLTDLSIALAEQGTESGSVVTVGRYSSGRAIAAVYPEGSDNSAAIDKIVTALKAETTDKALARKYIWSVWGIDPDTLTSFGP